MLKSFDSLDMESYFKDTSNKWDATNEFWKLPSGSLAGKRKEDISALPVLEDEPSAKGEKRPIEFLDICNHILEYVGYEPQEKKIHDSVYSSEGSTKTEDSFSSESNSSFGSSSNDETRSSDDDKLSDKDSDLITCHCMKPFAGRPMIECAECQTWIHMSCANIRRKNIPDVFICQMCREASGRTRRSQRLRADYQRLLSS